MAHGRTGRGAGALSRGPHGTDIAPTCKSFDVEFCAVALWDGGQTVEENLLCDPVGFRKQIGLSG